MSMDEVLDVIRSLDGVLVLSPEPGSTFPEVAWGDHFAYYAPDGVVPATQPFATLVTKDYPDDVASRLDAPSRWRLNVHVGAHTFEELVGESPRAFGERSAAGAAFDFAAVDAVLPHPVYGSLGWVAVVTPGERTLALALGLVRDAHADARRRATRRHGGAGREG
ncbi:DUF6194 family protein [Intrasporangium sp. YIM S08009]|uniref:DUF6194 family protein n=1 Tax=Intrasporangium zincisolvens TaxID=3080018 RepID=UPI002B05FFEF|nr:DUF6194 family protein [Intrasporangium sp. YIM S08009]